MKIIHVCNTVSPLIGGGTAERFLQLHRFCNKTPMVSSTILTLDIDLEHKQLKKYNPHYFLKIPCFYKRFFIPSIFASWQKIYRELKSADLVHIIGHWNILNIIIAVILFSQKKPYIVTPAGALKIFGRSVFLKKIYNILFGYFIIRNASGLIAVTEKEIGDFKAYKIKKSRITVISNGVDSRDFQPLKINKTILKYAIPSKHLILFMGRLSFIKGPDILLRAFILICNKLEKYHLVFAGVDEGMLPVLKKITIDKALGDRVHFLGHIYGQDKVNIYCASDILVVPSRSEAMSIVALEAGASGIPALLTDRCGFKSIKLIDRHLESLCQEVSIAKNLLHLLTNNKKRKKIGKNFNKYVSEHFLWKHIAAMHIQFYEKQIKR
jgi:glycosyltransferase involved in cell wall biosynthesis